MEGDEAALSRLLRDSEERLLREAAKRLDAQYRPYLSPEDVLQVTFIEAALRIGQLTNRTPGGFRRWLDVLHERCLIDALRHLHCARRPPPEKRWTSVSPEDSTATLLARIVGDGSTPSRRLRRQEMRRILERALEGLPPVYASVVRFYDLAQLSAKEIARRMGRSEGSVHMLRRRALRRLRELFDESGMFFTDVA